MMAELTEEEEEENKKKKTPEEEAKETRTTLPGRSMRVRDMISRNFSPRIVEITSSNRTAGRSKLITSLTNALYSTLRGYRVNLLYQRDLEEAYEHLRPPHGKFEVVFVALGSDEGIFRTSFSNMQWLAIPHEDYVARQRFVDSFAIPVNSPPTALLFAPDGTLEVEIRQDDAALFKRLFLKQLTLTELLGEHVTDSQDDKVSTSVLEGHEFEIVFINNIDMDLSFAKTRFRDKFGYNIPWYSPSVDGRKLCRLLKINEIRHDDEVSLDAGYLIILDPFGPPRSLNYFAFDILNTFGVEAYPFTLEKAAKLTKSKQEEKLVLDKLLCSFAPLRIGGFTHSHVDEIVLSELSGKRVLLLFATHSSYRFGFFMNELNKIYSERKGTDNHFEIIYISLDCDICPSSFPKCDLQMPWLVHPFVPDFADSLLQKVFEFEFPVPLPAIAAFGSDWNLVAKESNLALKEGWCSDYPFIKSNLGEEEVRRELIRWHNWDLELIFPGLSSLN